MNLIGTMMIQRSLKSSRTTAYTELLETEIACLKLAANGYRPQQTGEQLGLDIEEVEDLLNSAQQKLGAKNRLHAVGVAVSQGLIGIDVSSS